jgi:hypothetical protein
MVNLIFCGDREWTDHSLIHMVMGALWTNLGVFTVIEGEAKGADRISRQCARELGLPWKPFPANWHEFGKAAGPIRNTQMLVEGKAHGVVAFHFDIENSIGTGNMVRQALKKRVPVWIVTDGPDAFRKFIRIIKRLPESTSLVN